MQKGAVIPHSSLGAGRDTEILGVVPPVLLNVNELSSICSSVETWGHLDLRCEDFLAFAVGEFAPG